jgi:enoyl-[acyl-carrier-protein] reductase (NADH)
LSADIIGKVKISVYKNKKGYNSTYIENNGQKLEWKYQPEFLNAKVEKLQNKKGEVVSTDFTELDAFFKQQIQDVLMNKLNPNVDLLDDVKHEDTTDVKDLPF